MLIILRASPLTTPAESIFLKDLISCVILMDHISFIFSFTFRCLSLFINLSIRRRNLISLYPWIDPWIDIDSHSIRMVGKFRRSTDHTIIKRRGIICSHRLLIIRTIIIDQSHSLNSVFLLIKSIKDLDRFLRYLLVNDQLTLFYLPIKTIMKNLYIS